jgi:hypothetical protein
MLLESLLFSLLTTDFINATAAYVCPIVVSQVVKNTCWKMHRQPAISVTLTAPSPTGLVPLIDLPAQQAHHLLYPQSLYLSTSLSPEADSNLDAELFTQAEELANLKSGASDSSTPSIARKRSSTSEALSMFLTKPDTHSTLKHLIQRNIKHYKDRCFGQSRRI